MLDISGSFDTVDMVSIIDALRMKRLRITDLAKATGLSKSTLIRYEEDGKLPKAKRDGRKWRFYTEADCHLILDSLKKLDLI